MKDLIERQAAIQPEQQHGRVFKGVVVEYPPYNIWKPYFSIKYTENGQEFIGYGTYKPEVLSEYLKEYFMPSAQPELAQNLHNACTDLISRQAALDEGDEWIDTFDGDGDTDIRCALRLFKGGLKRLPSAQPDIIRCRNCKFASGDSRICMKFGHSPIGELDFCAWAERRTDD